MASAPAKVAPPQLMTDVSKCGVLVVASGFERRARRLLEMLDSRLPPRVIVVQYQPTIQENDANFKRMTHILSRHSAAVEAVTVPLDAQRPDEYLQKMKTTLLRWRPDAIDDVWIDVSALPMQGICSTLAAVRETLPSLAVRVIYTEAGKYFPTREEVEKSETPFLAMSKEMSGNLIPMHFGGLSSDALTCLIVFAGYEKHRSFGVVDELNPTRLVLVFGQPGNEQLAWRLPWSRKLHKELTSGRPTSEEIVSTLDPLQSLAVLNNYYAFLFSDHNIAVAPICSKMQCVACYLFWERYRDVQLVFPLPVSYLPRRFSEDYGDTFVFTLPTVAEMSALTPWPPS